MFLCAFLLAPATGHAQTVNPNMVSFLPSADHYAVGADGQPIVSSYQLEIFQQGATQALRAANIGKPAPAADGNIYVDFASTIGAPPATDVTLEARVAALGPAGVGESTPSNPFIFSSTSSTCTATVAPTTFSSPSSGGSASVSVTIPAGCTWQATSGASWITITAGASGSGSGAVTFFAAANPSTTTRTGTFTVASQTVMVTQTAAAAANLPPSVSLASPANGATYTVPAAIPISATASDRDGMVTNLAVYSNGNTLLGSTATSPYAMTWNVSNAGTYTITAAATDNSGATTTSASVTITVTAPDTAAPTVTINAPLMATSSTPTSPLTLNGTAADNVGVTQVSWVNSLGGSGTATGTSSWSASVPLLAGTNVITVTARDAAGNSGSASMSVSYSPQLNGGPSVQITSPSSGATLSGPTTITATASDSNGIGRVDFYVGTTLVGSDTAAPYSVRWNSSLNGTFAITAIATNKLGVATTSAPVAVTFVKKNGKR